MLVYQIKGRRKEVVTGEHTGLIAPATVHTFPSSPKIGLVNNIIVQQRSQVN
jgi:hypothetical protein